MSKSEFKQYVSDRLSNYPKDEVDKWIEYYDEMIDDAIEDGKTEDEAVAMLGDADNVVTSIKVELPLSTLVRTTAKEEVSKRKGNTLAIVLLILGSPIWGSIAIVFLALLLTFYLVIWSIIVACWATVAGIGVLGIGSIFCSVFMIVNGTFGSVLIYLGVGVIALAILMLAGLAMVHVTRFLIKGTAYVIRGVKRSLFTKGGRK